MKEEVLSKCESEEGENGRSGRPSLNKRGYHIGSHYNQCSI